MPKKSFNVHFDNPGKDTEARCHCGQLMAIVRKNGVELKCKRCKRIALIPFESLSPGDSDFLLPPSSAQEAATLA